MRRASIMSSTIWSAVHNRNNVFRDFFFLGGEGHFFLYEIHLGYGWWVVRVGWCEVGLRCADMFDDGDFIIIVIACLF